MDIVSPERRSEMMRAIRSCNTGPERIVRSWLHRRGFRFRLNSAHLPGRPDIVLPRLRTVILVHGCFWHRHTGCRLAYTPKTNLTDWQRKFDANTERDARVTAQLAAAGWRVIIIWECQVRDGSFAELLEREGF